MPGSHPPLLTSCPLLPVTPAERPECSRGAVWLAGALRGSRPLCWTGHGAAYALAVTLAEVGADLGCPSLSIPAYQARGREACVVSQSGRDIGARPQLLVTACERGVPGDDTPRLLVAERRDARPEWLPISFLADAVATVQRVASLPEWPRPVAPTIDPRRRIVVVAERGGPLHALADAARCKIAELPLDAISWDELGHGLHARIYQRPDRHLVVLLAREDDEPQLREAVPRWCAQAGVATREVRLSAPPGSGAGPLELFDHGLSILEATCNAHGIDWQTSRVPASADWLRDTSRRPTPRAEGGAR